MSLSVFMSVFIFIVVGTGARRPLRESSSPRIRFAVSETRHIRTTAAAPAPAPAPAHPSRHHVLEVLARDGAGAGAGAVGAMGGTLSSGAVITTGAAAIVVREAGTQVLDLVGEHRALVHVTGGVLGRRV